MDFNKVISTAGVDFGEMFAGQYLLGLISAFENRYQANADAIMKEITWKQFFVMICINLCKESPTLGELSEVVGSSHQNVKRILTVLEKKGFVQVVQDSVDGRKQRIDLTEKTKEFCKAHDEEAQRFIDGLFKDISEEDIETTIQTIIAMERNMRSL